MFYVGQKVVYVKHANDPTAWGYRLGLVIGAVYTVRELDSIYIPYFGCVGIRVEEVVTPQLKWRGGWTETAVRATCFRPAVERKTSIEIFTRMLNPSKERETV